MLAAFRHEVAISALVMCSIFPVGRSTHIFKRNCVITRILKKYEVTLHISLLNPLLKFILILVVWLYRPPLL